MSCTLVRNVDGGLTLRLRHQVGNYTRERAPSRATTSWQRHCAMLDHLFSVAARLR
ncbi:MAG: hypothetical protein WAW88_14455 [Nocardioides sp.]